MLAPSFDALRDLDLDQQIFWRSRHRILYFLRSVSPTFKCSSAAICSWLPHHLPQTNVLTVTDNCTFPFFVSKSRRSAHWAVFRDTETQFSGLLFFLTVSSGNISRFAENNKKSISSALACANMQACSGSPLFSLSLIHHADSSLCWACIRQEHKIAPLRKSLTLLKWWILKPDPSGWNPESTATHQNSDPSLLNHNHFLHVFLVPGLTSCWTFTLWKICPNKLVKSCPPWTPTCFGRSATAAR